MPHFDWHCQTQKSALPKRFRTAQSPKSFFLLEDNKVCSFHLTIDLLLLISGHNTKQTDPGGRHKHPFPHRHAPAHSLSPQGVPKPEKYI